jgi:hypothetical protein
MFLYEYIQTRIFLYESETIKTRINQKTTGTDFQNNRYLFPKIPAELRAPNLKGRTSKNCAQIGIQNWSKMILSCLAPFWDSGTKVRVTGLGNFGVEWVKVTNL